MNNYSFPSIGRSNYKALRMDFFVTRANIPTRYCENELFGVST